MTAIRRRPPRPPAAARTPRGTARALRRQRPARPKGTLWHALVRHFRALDRRPPSHIPFFNGNLFKPHFSEELVVSDEWLAHFLDELGDEESPYLFSYIPVEILGTIYERFLGKVVRPHGRGVTIEEKPEVRKAGGVYYTPRYIVEYIVGQTVGKLLAGRKPEEPSSSASSTPPAAPAASSSAPSRSSASTASNGSPTTRTSARRTGAGWTRKTPSTSPPRPSAASCAKPSTAWTSTPQAVEVTQLSLYLKMLENENRATLARERDLFGSDEPSCPPLENNIKCGNSLIASDFSMMPEDLVRVHAFDWPVQFPAIMKAGGFDAVIGNPPYIRIQGFPQDQVGYFVRNYRAATGNYDVYVNFVERGLKLAWSERPSRNDSAEQVFPNRLRPGPSRPSFGSQGCGANRGFRG